MTIAAHTPPSSPGAALLAAATGARADAELVVAGVAVPSGAEQALRGLELGHYGISWSPAELEDASGEGPCIVGLDAVRVVRTSGPDRFREAEGLIRKAFETVSFADDEARALPLRFFGGAAFVPGRDGSGCWESFGDATFVLPKWLYVDYGTRAVLALVLEPGVDDVAALTERADQLIALTAEPPSSEPVSLAAPTAELECRESTSESEWHELIDSIRGGIRSGEYSKVVAARRSTLRLSPAPNPARVLSQLDRLAPRCTRFSLRIGARTFVGATPERLVRRSGRRVLTEAIAGSIPATVPGAAERLAASHKDLAEHRYVVDAIRSVLSPLSARLDVGAAPEVRKLRHILHLRTPIEAELASDVHILELVSRLHPTPAVGGVPTEPALDWITSRESAERGWYASPVGWVDERGDGEMVVALRSALIHGDRVHLYAGAGIVDESDPALEYEETEVKMAGMRAALGLDTAPSP